MPIPRLIASTPHALFRRYRSRDHDLSCHYPHGGAWRATSMDWKARRAAFLCSLPEATVHQVLNKVGTLLDA